MKILICRNSKMKSYNPLYSTKLIGHCFTFDDFEGSHAIRVDDIVDSFEGFCAIM